MRKNKNGIASSSAEGGLLAMTRERGCGQGGGAVRRAFTLIELLVAISIIAILTAILLPNFMGTREKAKDAQRIQDLHALKNALRMYYNDNQNYPIYSGSFAVEGQNGCTSCLDVLVTGEYIPTLSGIGYSYASVNNNDGFWLWTNLDSGRGDEDIDSQVKCGIGSTVNGVFMVCGN